MENKTGTLSSQGRRCHGCGAEATDNRSTSRETKVIRSIRQFEERYLGGAIICKNCQHWCDFESRCTIARVCKRNPELNDFFERK